MLRSSTMSSLPSSLLVRSLSSDCLLYALMSCTASAGSCFTKSSPPKRLSPSIVTRMGLPFHESLPSSSTSTPGNFLISSSSLAPSCKWNASGWNTIVSPLTVKRRARPVTSTIFIICGDIFSSIVPMSSVSLLLSLKANTGFDFV